MRALSTALLISTGVLCAQQGEPEIRRAIPVEKPSPTPRAVPTPRTAAPVVPDDYDNPAWMSRVPRAEPVNPVAPAEPEVAPGAPFRPAPRGRIEVDPTPAPEAPEIRLSPSGSADPVQADLDVANSLYARKMYDYAIMEYEKFLIAHPSANGRDMALFRLGECHRMLGNDERARENYEKLLHDFRKGEFAGSAAYRLGEFLYAEGKFDPALIQFQLAASEVTTDEIRLSAQYQAARSLDRLKRPEEAAKAYEKVAAVEKNNPYRDYALLSLANAETETGKKDAALKSYERIVAGSGPAAVRAEAAVKAAALAAEIGDKKKAVRLFDLAVKLPNVGEWKTVAYLGALRMNYELGEYKKVAALAEKPLDDVPEDARAEVLLLAGNAYRQLGNTRAARAVYDRLLLQFPGAKPSEDARFHRLVSLYQLNDPNLLAEADKFLQTATNPREKAQVTLLKAEALFKAQKYAEAKPLYAQVLESDLPGDLKNKSFYKLGWCQAQTGEFALAVKTYTDYIARNKDADTASALLQRGIASQQLKDYAAAMKDFDELIAKNKGAEREVALQQKALILGQQQDYKGMTAAFQQLLDEYPKTTGAAQANFWIGWANFENKDYPAAIKNLEIASKLDAAQYGERSALRIILSYYYLQDRAALQKALATHKDLNIPVEITRWLGRKSFEEGDYEGAEQGLQAVVKTGNVAEPEIYIELAEAQIRLGKNREAAEHVAKYLETARDPRARARGLLASGAVALSGRDFATATKMAEEAILLQPEGRLNAEGRLLTGEISMASGDYPGAARAFMSVALLYDDPQVTPRALKRASEAYRRAGDLMESEKALQELQKRYPDFQKSPKISRESR
jgi:tetratricopeptide (TPR) repeat protein